MDRRADIEADSAGEMESDARYDVFSSDGHGRLLRRLGVLGLISTCVYLLSSVLGLQKTTTGTFIFLVFCVFSITYIAWVILRTRDMVAEPDLIHQTDLWICQRSGPGAVLIAAALFCMAMTSAIMHQPGDPDPIWTRSTAIIQLLHFIMEVGFVLSVACLSARKSLEHVRPLLLWKVLAGLLLIIFGLYVILVPLALVGVTLEEV